DETDDGSTAHTDGRDQGSGSTGVQLQAGTGYAGSADETNATISIKLWAHSCGYAPLKQRWSFCKVSPSWLLSLGDSTIILLVAFFCADTGSGKRRRYVHCHCLASGFLQARAHKCFARFTGEGFGFRVLVAVGHPLLGTA